MTTYPGCLQGFRAVWMILHLFPILEFDVLAADPP